MSCSRSSLFLLPVFGGGMDAGGKHGVNVGCLVGLSDMGLISYYGHGLNRARGTVRGMAPGRPLG